MPGGCRRRFRVVLAMVLLCALLPCPPPATAGDGRGVAVEPQPGAAFAWGNNGEQWGIQTQPVSVFEPAPIRVLLPLGVRVVAVAAGGTSGQRRPERGHSLALASDGTVWAWGVDYGQESVLSPPTTPTPVPGISDAVAIAGGGNHSLALGREGTVWAWGSDRRAAAIGDGARFTAIAAGGPMSLALKGDGTVWNVFSDPPVQIGGLADVVAIAVGGRNGSIYYPVPFFTALALKRDGTVWSWSASSNEEFFKPAIVRQVAGLGDIVAIAAGEAHRLAVRRDGMVWAWGSNEFGQLGVTAERCRYSACDATPVQVAGMPAIRTVAAGGQHSLALGRDGAVWAWGASRYGQRGDGTADREPHPTPVPVRLPSAAEAIVAGYGHSLALGADGRLRAWGLNEHGELGNGVRRRMPLPMPIAFPGGLRPIAIVAGDHVSRALTEDGQVWSWRANGFGLPDGDAAGSSLGPRRVAGLTEVTAIAGALAMRRDGTVWNTNAPQQQVPGLTAIVAIAAGYGHYLAVDREGAVWAWGDNRAGQLGDGTTTRRTEPVRVAGLPRVVAVAGGYDHSAALTAEGTVWTWGGPIGGRFDGPFRLVPEESPGPGRVTSITAGYRWTIALRADGTVWTWGLGGMPKQSEGLTDVVAVAVAVTYSPGGHTMYLRRDGTVWAAGNNSEGQLGDGTTSARPGLVQVRGLSGVTAIAAGVEHSLAISGSQRCFVETGQCVAGSFHDYWQRHGGLPIFGLPLTPARDETLEDGRGYRVQWFERARLEFHPENRAAQEILLGQFGRLLHPAEPGVAPRAGYRHFPETGHNVSPRFFAYWEANGGLAQFGYPLGEEAVKRLEDGNEYLVQYFERARFELHPENAAPFDILLGQFGRRILDERDRPR